MKKQRDVKLPLRLITITFAVIIFLIFSCAVIYSFKFVLASNYFRVKDVIAKEANAEDFFYLKGKNIFSIDLKYEASRILEFYPDCNKIRMIRILPNRIFVDFIKRKPVAFVRLYRYFAVDKDGVFFPTLLSPEDAELPIILGLETKIFGLKVGRRYNINELSVALSIIREVALNKALRNYKISKINASTLSNTAIFLSPPSNAKIANAYEVLEVKVDADNIKDKMAILAGLIVAAKNEIANIKYIDLRFKEPVIKLKDK